MNVDEVLQRVVFSVDGDERTWNDVVEAARASGEWEELERLVRERPGLSGPRTRREVEADADAFRYERNLLSVDDTRLWLEGWGISVEEWLSHLARSDVDVPARDQKHAIWMEAVTSGLLERVARRLAHALAAHHAVIDESARPAVGELDGALEHFAASVSSPERLAAVIADHRLAWTTFRLHEVAVGEEGVAQEVVHSLQDGIPLRDVARAAGTQMTDRSVLFESAASELQTRLSGSAVGETIGPFRSEDQWVVVSVVARTEPRADDPEMLTIARCRAVQQALMGEVARRVRWLDPVMTQAR